MKRYLFLSILFLTGCLRIDSTNTQLEKTVQELEQTKIQNQRSLTVLRCATLIVYASKRGMLSDLPAGTQVRQDAVIEFTDFCKKLLSGEEE